MRKIVHVDMDAFFAAVEQRDRPDLRGLPVAVGGAGERGVVMTASYEARRFGIGSAMPMALARRRCAELVIVPPRFDAYAEASRTIRAIFHRYTDLVEPLSLDEAFLDVTYPLVGPPSATLAARAIKAAILAETGLTASAGVANGKFIAKVASAMRKPDGLTVVHPDESAAFVAALPIERFVGVGPKTAERLRALGIHTGADLRAFDPAELETRFGKAGAFLHRIARGDDPRPVVADRARRSIGAERTFERDVDDADALSSALARVCGVVADRLERSGLAARTVTVKAKYRDFRVVTRSHTPPSAVASRDDLWPVARALLFETPRPAGALRLVGVSVKGLLPRAERVVQPGLPFGPTVAPACGTAGGR